MRFRHQGIDLASGFVQLQGWKTQKTYIIAISNITELIDVATTSGAPQTTVVVAVGAGYVVAGTAREVAEKIALARA